MPDEELYFLLEQSRRDNEQYDITGMLLYMQSRFLNKLEGRFMQLLEVREKDVRNIYDRIRQDERHHHVMLLTEGYEQKRSFAEWSMGFKAIDEHAANDVSGYFQPEGDFLQRAINTPSHLNFLRSFYQINS
ncbi:MAG TPA: BLUF domain-containing protein, partial [Mucilaginibacter sp.]|nr:BLUF domain-containing protein [Mucilaginibacter sp.]